MQTFLPYKDFNDSAKSLDSRRLNKQILESYQILKVLSHLSETGGWRNHPAVKMWQGSESVLFMYTMAMIREADRRGIKTDKNRSNINLIRSVSMQYWGSSMPEWYTNKEKLRRVTTTHKANLYRKDPEFYHSFATSSLDIYNEPCCESCNYYWPTHELRKANTR